MAERKLLKEKVQKIDKSYDKELIDILNKVVYERGLISYEVFKRAKIQVEKL